MTPEEIERAIDAWLETSPVLHTYHHDGSRSTYSETIGGRNDLVCYLEDEAPLNAEGVRYLVIPGIDGEIILQETKGGEGEGDYAHAVLKIDDRYFMLHGYHRSHDGTYYDSGFSEVKPVQKLVDDWQNV